VNPTHDDETVVNGAPRRFVVMSGPPVHDWATRPYQQIIAVVFENLLNARCEFGPV